MLVVCLFRPMLLLSAAVPQRNYVGVLIDDSRSMRIADRDGKPRSDWIEHAVRRTGQRAAQGAARRSSSFACSAFRPSAQRVDSVARPDVQRDRNARSAARSSRRARSSTACRCPVSSC